MARTSQEKKRLMREPSTIGERIRVVRRREELTIDQFAAALGYSKRALINWEQNAAQPPIGVLEPLRRLYDADPEWIATGRSRDAIPPAADWDRYDRLAAMLDTVLLDTEVDVGPDQRQTIVRALYDSGVDPGDSAYAQPAPWWRYSPWDPAERATANRAASHRQRPSL